MEKIAKYQEIVLKELKYRQSTKIYNGPNLKRHLVINKLQTEFVLLDVGWFNKRYISDLVFHIEIKNDKIWIHEDNTDIDIASVLVEEGIQKEDVVLAFLPDYAKELSNYAIA